jgi:hypothetical protein
MAPWAFAAPAIAFALLPSVVGAEHVVDAVAVVAVVTTLTAVAGVLIQPLARRLDAHAASNRAGVAGLLVLTGGLVVGAATVQAQQPWLLLPCAIVLGCAYGLCLVAGLVEVQRIANDDAIASLTAAYYALTYLGFAAPYLLRPRRTPCEPPVLLLITAALALGTAAVVARRSAQHSEYPIAEQHAEHHGAPWVHLYRTRALLFPNVSFGASHVPWRRLLRPRAVFRAPVRSIRRARRDRTAK